MAIVFLWNFNVYTLGYWWFAYDVIKNMIMQVMIDCVSVPNLKSFRPTKTKLWAKEGGEFSIMLYGKMGWGHSLAYQHGCRNINVWRSSKF